MSNLTEQFKRSFAIAEKILKFTTQRGPSYFSGSFFHCSWL